MGIEQKVAISPYAEYRKSDDIHGTVLYPAVMVAPVQRDILREHLRPGSTATVCDPFVGSGTALYEAMRISGDARLVGSDINPLAVLISRVKLEGVDETIRADIAAVSARLRATEGDVADWTFPGMDKWFQPEITQSLRRVRDAVSSIRNARNRRFLWYMMIDIVRKYCNSRSSTYKLHVRTQAQLDRMRDGVIDDYLRKLDEEHEYFLRDGQPISPTLNQGDSISFLSGLDDDCVDICITSPPYGDNTTTVPYGQYSVLAMSWIDGADLGLQGWELDGYAAIDSRSLGGCRHTASCADDSPLVDEVILRQIGSMRRDKRLKVVRFMHGYQRFLNEMVRVTKDVAIVTLGNRTVDGLTIDLVAFTRRHLASRGSDVQKRMERTIRHKRTPRSVSRVNGGPVASMAKETVLVIKPKG